MDDNVCLLIILHDENGDLVKCAIEVPQHSLPSDIITCESIHKILPPHLQKIGEVVDFEHLHDFYTELWGRT